MKQDKLLAKILKDRNFTDDSDMINDIKEDYLEYLLDNSGDLIPKSGAKENYVGIEIECFTDHGEIALMEQLLELGLERSVQIDGDGSIVPDFGEDKELKVLFPEKKLSAGIKKLSKMFKKGFGVNDSCGLHIHLDMRNRDVEKCYAKLLKFQDVLFSMVEPERRSSEYCMYTDEYNKNQRYVAINKSAYYQHKTIEIRLHQATLNMKHIEKWINLLLRIIGDPRPPAIKTKADVMRWAKKHKGLTSYVNKNFDDDWFKAKRRA